MTWPIGKPATLGFGLLIAVLIIDATTSYYNMLQLYENDRWVAHTHEVLTELEAVLSTVKDAETGQRGFLITGEVPYLEPYNDAVRRVQGRLDHLRELTVDNALRSENIRLLQGRVDLKFSELRHTIALRKEKGPEAAREVVLTGRGKREMDAIRVLIADMESQEQALLAERAAQSAKSLSVSLWSNYLAAVLSLAVTGFAFYLIRQEFAARARAEKTARLGQEQLQTTLTSIGDAVIVTDAHGRITLLNLVAQTLTGWREEAVGQELDTVFRIVNEDTRATVESPVAQVLRVGAIVGMANHTILIAKDGREIPIDDSGAPIRDVTGKIRGVVLVFRDITQRKHEEAELAERLRLLAMSAEVGAVLTQGNSLREALQRCAVALVQHLDGAFARVWTLNSQGDTLELQASAGLYTHLDGAHGRVPVGRFKIGMIAQQRQPHLTNAVVGDPQVPEQEWARREGLVAFAGYPLVVDERLVGVMAMFARHPLAADTLAAMASVANQVALGIERKRAEQEVIRLLAVEKERSESLRQVAVAASTINSATDPNSVVGVIRTEASRIFGAYHSEVRLPTQEAAPSGALTVPLIGRGGRPLGYIDLQGKAAGPFTAEDEAVLRQLALIAAVALENAGLYQELREGDRRKDEFLATLAHELRNPLAPLRNALHILRLTNIDAATTAEAQAMMERQVSQMVRLVDDLLDVSRITRGMVELRKERVELAAILRAAVETSRPLIDAARHQLEVALPGPAFMIDADPTRLAQIVANLLNNAAKYTDTGGHIWLTAERHGDEAVIRVRDTGIGIPADMLPHVFDMFIQVDRSLERSRSGLGIGLTLVRRLVEMHGGRVEAASAGLGQGSEFTVRLPARVSAAPNPHAALPDQQGNSTEKLPPRRILVVDDNKDSAESLATLLELMGNEVRTVHDGTSAVEAATAFIPDLVLLDIGLPGLNGYEVARRLRETPSLKHVVLAAQTGWGQEEDRRRTRDAGFDYHLVKPIAPDALKNLLASLRVPDGKS